jgi:hypothetical protein
MSKKQSLAAALQSFDRMPSAPMARTEATTTTATRRAPKKTASITQLTQAPSRHGKKALIGYFEPGVSKQLKQLALDRDTTTQELLREALNDFFQKNSKPAIA